MTSGQVSFVLHTHLPYCRLAGRWPHGEEWFHEAMLECYLPLVGAFSRLAAEGPGSLGVTINVTPVLAEQMADRLMQAHFQEYLDSRIGRARADIGRFGPDHPFHATALFHAGRYEAMAALWSDLEGDVVGALRRLEDSGHIEVATSAATHGYLPLLGSEEAVRFQVETGIASHVRNFGRAPRSFWLPECAYTPGLERVLADAGVRVFFVETHLVTGGRARGKAAGGVLGLYPEALREVARPAELPETAGTTFRPYLVGESNVAVLARNERTGKQVWSAAEGYPGDGIYREFHKKDGTSGLHYWRVTGDGVDLGDKAPYSPSAAAALAAEHAGHFRGVIRDELEAYRAVAGEPGIVMASYDTELYGHWWLEGVAFLEEAIRQLRGDPSVELTGTADYIAAHPPSAAITLPEGSWGDGGDHRTWMNETTAWTWPELRARQARASHLLAQSTPASRQLARELLLLQSSDWQFLMTTGQAHEYAVERFRGHAARFDALASAIEAGAPSLPALLDELEALDNPFPDIDPLRYGAKGPAEAPAQR